MAIENYFGSVFPLEPLLDEELNTKKLSDYCGLRDDTIQDLRTLNTEKSTTTDEIDPKILKQIARYVSAH